MDMPSGPPPEDAPQELPPPDMGMPPPPRPSVPGTKVYVGNIREGTPRTAIEEIFSKYVVSVISGGLFDF